MSATTIELMASWLSERRIGFEYDLASNLLDPYSPSLRVDFGHVTATISSYGPHIVLRTTRGARLSTKIDMHDPRSFDMIEEWVVRCQAKNEEIANAMAASKRNVAAAYSDTLTMGIIFLAVFIGIVIYFVA